MYFLAQSCCSQSRSTNQTCDCYVSNKAHLRVCYIVENYHTTRPVFIYFISDVQCRRRSAILLLQCLHNNEQ